MARRIIGEVRPRYVVLENVADVVRAGWLAHVLADLAVLGFDAEWGCLSAAAVGAPHRRERFWLLAWHVADTEGVRPLHPGPATPGRSNDARNGSGPRSGRWPPLPDDRNGWAEWVAADGPEPQIRRSADGATGRMVRPVGLGDRLHLLGNGLVPLTAAHAVAALAVRAEIGTVT